MDTRCVTQELDKSHWPMDGEINLPIWHQIMSQTSTKIWARVRDGVDITLPQSTRRNIENHMLHTFHPSCFENDEGDSDEGDNDE